MPDQVRIVQKKDARFDDYVSKLIAERGYGRERVYAGLVDEEAADEIRRKLRAAGRHLGVAVKAFYEPCPDRSGRCAAGHECRFHVRYSAFQMADARSYKAKLA